MQLRHLKTFVAVASTLNITRAAEDIHLAQSSVSEQIQALEADLGTALFDRSRRRLRLTEAGCRLLEHTGDLLALADEARSAVADAGGVVTGILTIGGLETLCASRLPPLLARFCRAHPSVRLQLKAGGSGELRSGTRAGTMDVCFAFGAPARNSDLQSEVVARESLVVIAPRGHRLAGRDVVGPADIADETFLVTEEGCVYRQMFEDAILSGSLRRPRIAGEFSSLAAIRSLVESGLGCALVPRLVLGDTASNLISLPWNVGSVPISMIWRRRRLQSPILRLFLETARESFGVVIPADARHRRAARFR